MPYLILIVIIAILLVKINSQNHKIQNLENQLTGLDRYFKARMNDDKGSFF